MKKYRNDENTKLNPINLSINLNKSSKSSNKVIKWNNKIINVQKSIRSLPINYFLRILNSLIPFNFLFYEQIKNSPDILGPFLIYTFLSISFSLVLFHRCPVLLVLFNNKFLLLLCAILINNYIIGLLLPFINTFIFNVCKISKTSYRYFICIYGYSFCIFIPILLSAFIINRILILIFLFGIGVSSSIFFIISNFYKLGNKNYSSCKKLFITSYVVFILLLSLYFHNYLYNNLIIDKSLNIFISKISKTNNLLQPNKINNNVKIAIAADDRRIYPSLVCLTSLMENIDSHTKYIIYVITLKKYYEQLKSKLDTLFEIYGNSHLNISYLFMKDNEYNLVRTNPYITKTAFYRINLGSLLPNDDKILYIDVDIVNFHDLSDLYNTPLKENTYIGAVLNYPDYIKEINRIGIPAKFEINSGVLLFNLIAYRKYDVEKKIKEFTKKNYLNHHDETAINAICYKNTEILPIKFNIQKSVYKNGYKEFQREFKNKQNPHYRYKDKELIEGYYSPINLHFTGWVKPWNNKKSIKFIGL